MISISSDDAHAVQRRRRQFAQTVGEDDVDQVPDGEGGKLAPQQRLAFSIHRKRVQDAVDGAAPPRCDRVRGRRKPARRGAHRRPRHRDAARAGGRLPDRRRSNRLPNTRYRPGSAGSSRGLTAPRRRRRSRRTPAIPAIARTPPPCRRRERHIRAPSSPITTSGYSSEHFGHSGPPAGASAKCRPLPVERAPAERMEPSRLRPGEPRPKLCADQFPYAPGRCGMMDMRKRRRSPRVAIGHVHLRVSDLDRALAFYEGALGFEVTQRIGERRRLPERRRIPSPHPVEYRDPAARRPAHYGVYHFAIRYPESAGAARALSRAASAGAPLDGGLRPWGLRGAVPSRPRWPSRSSCTAIGRARMPVRRGSLPLPGRSISTRCGRLAAETSDARQRDRRSRRISEAIALRDCGHARCSNLHKVLLDDTRAAYEMDRGRVGSNATLLQLVINDPWFAWLHPLSELVVRIDETLQPDAPATEADGTMLARSGGAPAVAAAEHRARSRGAISKRCSGSPRSSSRTPTCGASSNMPSNAGSRLSRRRCYDLRSWTADCPAAC